MHYINFKKLHLLWLFHQKMSHNGIMIISRQINPISRRGVFLENIKILFVFSQWYVDLEGLGRKHLGLEYIWEGMAGMVIPKWVHWNLGLLLLGVSEQK